MNGRDQGHNRRLDDDLMHPKDLLEEAARITVPPRSDLLHSVCYFIAERELSMARPRESSSLSVPPERSA